MTDRPHAMYRLFGSDEALLYIGISVAPDARFKAHRRDKSWWLDVVERRIEWHPSRTAALAAERLAIQSERPIHNAIHRGRATCPTPSVHPLGPQRNIRIPAKAWSEAERLARVAGKRDGVSQLLREFTAWYAGQPGAALPRRPAKT